MTFPLKDDAQWRKASYSMNNGACVEIAISSDIAIRDSTDPDGPHLNFTARAFDVFTAKVKVSHG